MPPAAKCAAAGTGFKAAANLQRGMADLSMDGAEALSETVNYEFKENDLHDAKQSVDDIDDFERRLAGGGAPTRSAPAPAARKPASRPVARPAGMAPAGAMSGAEYVAAAKAEAKAKASAARGFKAKKPAAGGGDDEFGDEMDDARQAMSDLNRFNDGLGSDDDD